MAVECVVKSCEQQREGVACCLTPWRSISTAIKLAECARAGRVLPELEAARGRREGDVFSLVSFATGATLPAASWLCFPGTPGDPV